MTRASTTAESMLGTFILPIAAALRLRGEDPLEVMTAVGIDAAKVANPEWRIEMAAMNDLLASAIELTGDEAFGLLAAEQLQPQVLHGLGLAWLASDTVYDGLKRMVRFNKLISTAGRLQLLEEGALVKLLLVADALPGEVRASAALRDYGVAMVVRMCRLTLGEFLAPVDVMLTRPVPDAPDRWEYVLASRVGFDAHYDCISFAAADIREPLITGDPALARVNDEQTESYLNSFVTSTTTRQVVAKIIERLPDGAPSQPQIAQSLHLSNRTLQRKLKEEGTSFIDLLQDTRLQLARKYLQHPTRSIVETSYLLGFSEPSTFSRAFKRWTGQAPAEFRDQRDATGSP